MPTEKQLAANRLNAQNSTGPQSAAGKARCALNALKSGIYAESLLLPGEKLEDLRALIDEYYLSYTPRTPAARAAVDSLIRAEWLSRRLARIDTQILAHEISDLWKPVAGCTEGQAFSKSRVAMQKVQQRITATDNLYHRNLKLLQALQPDSEDADPETTPQTATDPNLSTAESIDTTPQTEDLGSFRKTDSNGAAKPTPAVSPILDSSPSGHPADYRDCPNCLTLGYHNRNCHYVLYTPHNDHNTSV